MLNNIVSFGILIITIAFLFLFVYSPIKKEKNYGIKTIYIIIFMVVFIPFVIFYIDYYDITYIISFYKNLNIDRWFDFLSNYISTIMGTILGFVGMYIIMMIQVREQINDNNDNKRLENQPIFKYIFNEIQVYNCVFLGRKTKETLNQGMVIYNIGLNHAKNVKIKYNDVEKYINDDGQSFLLKDGKINVIIYINKKINSIYIEYEDMLNNKYQQKIDIVLSKTNNIIDKVKVYPVILL